MPLTIDNAPDSAGPGTWCSRASAAVGEPTAGTAPVARAWLVIEQPGPWGRDAVWESRLPAGVAARLSDRAAGTGVRLALARRTGRHPDLPGDERRLRRAWLAYTVPGDTRLTGLRYTDPAELLDLDLASFGSGGPAGTGEPVDGPLMLVCTNARRDRCCAAYGRPLAQQLAGRYPELVWEGSHLGGHRFAPTAVVLPTGYVYGRLTGAEALRVLAGAEAGTVHLPGLRGRSTWDRAAQVAEIAVRAHTGEPDPDALVPGAARPQPAGGVTVPVRHRDGHAWLVTLVQRDTGVTRPDSCGKQPRPVDSYQVTAVVPSTGPA